VFVVSWSLLTTHTTSAIALKLMRVVYRSTKTLDIKERHKIFISYLFEFYFPKTLTIWFGKRNPNQRYYWNFCRAREKATEWKK